MSKPFVILFWILAVTLIWLGASSNNGMNFDNKDCWNKYPTEQQAIEMCEGGNK